MIDKNKITERIDSFSVYGCDPKEEITITGVSEERRHIDEQSYFNEIGNGYIEFGTALKNPETTIADLLPLANKLGLAPQVRIVGHE